MMKVDVYKRSEERNLCSYLIVPNQNVLPEEVANTDWQVHELNVDFERGSKPRFTLKPDDAFYQLGEKGYAISHLDDRVRASEVH
jgi:hypothetical protein